MSDQTKQPDERPERPVNGTGGAARMEAYRQAYRATGDHRQGVRAYCQGNKWLTENAKAVGNWPRD
jgi:hypothetical protein